MVWVLLLQIQGGIAKTWYGFFFYKYKWSAKTWYELFFYKYKGGQLRHGMGSSSTNTRGDS